MSVTVYTYISILNTSSLSQTCSIIRKYIHITTYYIILGSKLINIQNAMIKYLYNYSVSL